MTQFEYDQLKILAGAWDIEATKAAEPFARLCRRHADELRELIRNMKTETAPPPSGEPQRLPPMRWPSDRPTIPGDET